MARSISLWAYLWVVAAVFVAMVAVTLMVFLAVQRAAHHLPGARPDLTVEEPAAPAPPPAPGDSGAGP